MAATPNLTDEELAKLAEQEAKTEVITVTGSTIERKTLTTPAPVTVLNRDDLIATGRSTVGDILQQLPAQSNAINAQVNNGGDGATRVDLRGLGANRTLVLINGRRVVAGGTGADSSVDLNAIPLAVIERVEVLKDGASAVYGSDAVSGVVNIITRSDFTGTEASIYTGAADKGDGFTYDASFVTGHTSENKKGNVVFAAGVQRQDSVFSGDRDFAKYVLLYDFPTKTVSHSGSPTVPGGALDAMSAGLVIPNCPSGFCIGTGPHGADGLSGWRDFQDPGDNYNFAPANYLYTPSARYNIYSSGSYKLTEDVNGFFEASYLNRTSDQQLAPEPFGGSVAISKDSVYNPFGVDIPRGDYVRRLEEFGPRRSLQDIDTFRIVAGFEGKVTEDVPVLKDWKYEVSYNYGRTNAIQHNEGNLIKSHLANAMGPSMMDPKNPGGPPICVKTPGDASTVIPGCVPINILGLGPSISPDGVGSISPDQIPYVTFTGLNTGFNEQQSVLAQAHGRITKLPNNGDVSLALGTDYRKESGGFTPDPLTATGDTTGNATAPTGGSFNVVEGYGELSVVPISGQDLAQWVELDVAGRAFRYNTFGSGATWKVGGLFRTINGIAVRGTYSTAFRAPSINELFQGAADDFTANSDPCDAAGDNGGTRVLDPVVEQRCEAAGVPRGTRLKTAQPRAVDSGNAKLKAEKAKVATAGIVLEPPQTKGLSATVDYWHVQIDNAIQQLGSGVILNNCYLRGVQQYCDMVHRDPVNHDVDKLGFVDNPELNVGGTTTDGLDFALAYNAKTEAAGRFHGQAELQYTFKYDLDNSFQVLHGRGFYDLTGLGLGVYPKYKANFSGQWMHPIGLGAGVNVRYVGSYKECDQNNCNDPTTLATLSRTVDAWYKVDLNATYQVKTVAGTTTLSVGVNNVLDKAPPVVYNGPAANTDIRTYDLMGRFLYARVSQLF